MSAFCGTIINVHLLICMYMPVHARSDACAAGYFGPNCSLSCRYPSYGAACQFGCVCGIKNCNHITGCQNSNLKENSTMLTPSEERTSPVVIDDTINDGLKENSTMLTPSEERTSPAVIDDTINDVVLEFVESSTMLTPSEERTSPVVIDDTINDGVRSGCSSMRTKTNKPAKQEAMKNTIWIMVSILFVFVTIYFKLNTKKTLETTNVI